MKRRTWKPTLAHPCGCLSEGDRWVQLCEEHRAEEREVHERWMSERASKNAQVARQGEVA